MFLSLRKPAVTKFDLGERKKEKKRDSETLLKDTAQGPTLLKKLRFNQRYKTLYIPTPYQQGSNIIAPD